MTAEELIAGTVLPIDKPLQWTSFQAVNKVKSIIRNLFGLKKFKIGHAGTLDPLATGLLLVCVGRATKSIEQLQLGAKVYSGTMVLGATTPCYDLEQAIDHFYTFGHIDRTLIEKACQQFVGDIEQVPPVFSAVKIDGQRSYMFAREGTPDTVPDAKKIHIDSFEITAFRPGKDGESLPAATESIKHTAEGQRNPQLYNNPQGIVPPNLPQIDFRITCGKGTYIRSIARDMGIALNCGAFLSSLRRERIGEYTIEQALDLSNVETFIKNTSYIKK